MTKKVERTGDPASVQVPWGAGLGNTQAPIDDALVDAFDQMPDVAPRFAAPTGAGQTEPGPVDRFADAIKSESVFSGEIAKQASPFAPPPKPKAAAEAPKFEMGEAPLWGDLVRFVQKHGDVIIQVRHPQPRGEAVDTIWRGVTCFAYETCELRHVKHGWVKWADAQYT